MIAKQFLAACLAALALGAQATPLSFFDTHYSVTSIATSDAAAGFDTWSGPLASGSMSASADSVGDLGIAVAGAVAGPGLLTASADVSGSSGMAYAVATTNFMGSFINEGRMKISVDFAPFASFLGNGVASTSLFVVLVSDGITLFEDFISESWEFDYGSLSGSVASLDLTLTSEAVTGFPSDGPGSAAALGIVTFGGGTVPTPGTLLLLVAGLGCLAVAKRRRV